MKTILKKSLAMAVCVALCLTAFIGCLTVSASGTATAVISTATVTSGTTSTSLTVTISGSPNIAGARFDIVADATKATLGTPTVTTGASVEVSTPATDTTRFVVVADNVSTGLASIVVTLPYTNVTTTAGTYDVEFGSLLEVAEVGETLMTVTPTDGSITVQAAHVHDFSGAWQSNETYHWKVCPADSETGNQAAHTFGDWTTTVDPGCTTTGTKTRTCSVCGYVESDTVAATGHTPAAAVQENVVPATCNTAGSYDSVVYCSVCNAEISRTTGVVIPATGDHTPAAAVQENVVAATCGAAGSYDSVVYCSECGTEISRTTGVVIPATGAHTWGDWVITAEGHSRTCTVCSAADTTNNGAHVGDPCSVCGYTAPVAEPTEIFNNLMVHDLFLSEAVGSQITVNYNAKNGIKSLGYDDYYLVINYQYYGAGYALQNGTRTLLPSQKTRQNAAGTIHYFVFSDIALYEMPLSYTVICYLKDSGGNTVAFKQDSTSIVTQALAYAAKYSSDTALLKTLVDMVNYGAVAQTYFASLNPESDIDGAALPNADFDAYQTYASSSEELPASFNNTKALTKNDPSTGLNASATLQIAASNNIKYTFLATGYNAANLTAVISYTNAYDTVVSETVSASEMTAKAISGGKMTYEYYFKKLALYDLDETITVQLFYNEALEATYTYSAGNFVNSNISNAQLNGVLTAMELFAQSARAKLVG